ncbi:MAG: fluoride efflux transporter FluC [Dehalococcoidia bacterium]
MKEAGLVMIGGAGGALTRYLVHLMISRLHGPRIAATFAVNGSGSFVLGFVFAFFLPRTSFPPGLHLFVGFGLLSSYTTVSALMWDSFQLAQNGSLLSAWLNLSASFAVGLASVASGFLAGSVVEQAIR